VGGALGRPPADLPERFGPYQTVKRRYYRWIKQGVFDRIFEAVSSDPDME
jgi:transposase